MAIQSRRGNKVNFDKDKMLPGEFGIALDSQEAFICFGAGVTKHMATYEDFSDMIDGSITATENAKQATVNANTAVADFRELEVNKLAIDDSVRSTASGWSSTKIGTEIDTIKDSKVDKSKVTASLVTTENGFIADSKAIKTINDKADANTKAINEINNNLGNIYVGSPIAKTVSANTLTIITNPVTLQKGTYIVMAKTNATYSQLVLCDNNLGAKYMQLNTFMFVTPITLTIDTQLCLAINRATSVTIPSDSNVVDIRFVRLK